MKKFLTDILEFADGVSIDGGGILRGLARIGRIGVQQYWIDGKKVGVLRTEEEVLKSKDSFANQPVTLNHPPGDIMVDSENYKDYSVGFSGNVDYTEGWLESLVTVGDKNAVAAARATHRQFSNGYWADLVEEPGIWVDEMGVQGKAGESYDYKYVQKDITGNHISLVMAARAGDGATFKDGANTEKCFIIVKDEYLPKKAKIMQITDHRNVTYAIDADHASEIATYIKYLNDELAAARKDMEHSKGKEEEMEEDMGKHKKDLEAKDQQLQEITTVVLAATNKDSVAEAITELKANGMNPEYAVTTVKYCTELWSSYMKDGGDPSKIDPTLDAEGIKDFIMSETIPDYATLAKDASPEDKRFMWKYKDIFATAPSAKDNNSTKVPDTINNKILSGYLSNNKDQQPQDPIKDSQQEYLKNAQEVKPGNM